MNKFDIFFTVLIAILIVAFALTLGFCGIIGIVYWTIGVISLFILSAVIAVVITIINEV